MSDFFRMRRDVDVSPQGTGQDEGWGMQQRIGVRIHSDDPVVRDGVVSMLRQQPEVTLREDGDQPGDAVLVLCVDSVDEAALEVMRKLWRTGPVQTVLLVGQIREAELFDALECGVAAVVRRREVSPERVVRAIQTAHRGGGDLPPDLLGGLLSHVGRARRSGSGEAMLSGFSNREIDVIKLVAEGLETREIAAKLCYSERTVKSVLQGIMLRLNLRNRAHAVAYAAREGYLR
jgi:DNA-binding NarL/FixJ family response regulator